MVKWADAMQENVLPDIDKSSYPPVQQWAYS